MRKKNVRVYYLREFSKDDKIKGLFILVKLKHHRIGVKQLKNHFSAFFEILGCVTFQDFFFWHF